MLMVLMLGGCVDARPAPVLVRVRIENISSPTAISTSTGDIPVRIPPGAWVLSNDSEPFFTEGEPDRGQGLEALAEDGLPLGLAAALDADGHTAGTFELLDITYESGSIDPGESFVFDLYALPGDRLHLATMLGESNDAFYATEPEGIVLFEHGEVRTAEVTSRVALFDLGTEVDEPLGEGPNQAARQSMTGAGIAQAGVVTRVSAGAPAASTVLRITIAEVP